MKEYIWMLVDTGELIILNVACVEGHEDSLHRLDMDEGGVAAGYFVGEV